MKRWLCVVMAVAACKARVAGHRGPLHEKEVPDGVAAPDDAAFVIAKPVVTHAPTPARFGAALPATVDDLARPTPPGPYVKRALANNTNGMRERLLAAAKRAQSPLVDDVVRWYRDALGYIVEDATCNWLLASTNKVPPGGRALLWKIVEKCHGPNVAAALDRDDVPASLIMSWSFDHFANDPALPLARVAKAANELAHTPNQFELREIGFVFARIKSEESVAAMKALQATISDPKTRALVSLGMLEGDLPSARALGKEACKQLPDDVICDRRKNDLSDYRNTPVAAPTLESMIDAGEDLSTMLETFPRPRVMAALEKCASSGKYSRDTCLEQLAALDRDHALAVARSLQTDADKRIARVARTFVKFPAPGAQEKELLRLGFTLEPEKLEPDQVPAIDMQSLLYRRGRIEAFDVETDTFPNEHDELLARLAALAKPDLDDVVFEEVSPREAEDEGPYQLYAYTHGKRYALVAHNNGDWYDVDAVLGLLNALLVARGSDTRMVLLPTGDQTAIVLAGPKSGILELSKSGLLELAGASDAEKTGKEFEDRVFNELSKEGKDVQRDVKIDVPVD